MADLRFREGAPTVANFDSFSGPPLVWDWTNGNLYGIKSDGSIVVVSGNGFVSGCRLNYDAGGTLGAKSGKLEINGTIYSNSSAVTLGLSGMTADQWRYVYAAPSGGGWALEVSSTVPVWDHALGYQKKTGDATRRYLGPILASAAATMYPFSMVGEGRQRVVNVMDSAGLAGGGPLTVVNSVLSTVAMATVDVSAAVPAGCDGFDVAWTLSDNAFAGMLLVASGDPNATLITGPQFWTGQGVLIAAGCLTPIHNAARTMYWSAADSASVADGNVTANAYVTALRLTV